MGLGGTVTSLWWLADAAFALGMTAAFNTNSFKELIKTGYLTLNSNYILGEKETPQHVKKSLDLLTPWAAYQVIRALLLFCTTWNTLYLMLHEKESSDRLAVVNLLYTFYPLMTVFVSAHDVLLHGDRKLWTPDVKRRHVLFPVNLEANKVFPDRLSRQAVDRELLDNNRWVKFHGLNFLLWGIVSFAAWQVLPRGTFFLYNSVFIIAQRRFLLFLNHLQDVFTTKVYRNKYEHWFGDIFQVVGDDKHEDYGRQYQYFNYHCKPLTTLCHTQFYKRIRAMGGNVAEGKAAFYLGRGVLVCLFMWMINLGKINFDNWRYTDAKVFQVLPEVMLYYILHASYAYYIQGTTDKFKEKLPRLAMVVVEMEVAGFLFYKPILEYLEGQTA